MADQEKEKRQYTNEQQRMFWRALDYLAQDIMAPKLAGEVAQALGLSNDQAFRTLWNLVDSGLAEESARGYRLSPKITRYAERLRLEVADTLTKYLPEGNNGK